MNCQGKATLLGTIRKYIWIGGKSGLDHIC
jgi:hypothetical protein